LRAADPATGQRCGSMRARRGAATNGSGR
jgi:hypothetical protein